MPTRPRQHGFTIIELIVTMAILGLMLFMVSRLFNDTSIAVTTSVQTSKAIATSRSINEQFTNDANEMVGPGDPATEDAGYIVIVQHALRDVTMIDPRNLSEINVEELRSDQLLFIRDAEGLRSMTPQSAGSYRTNLMGMAGDRAKVWYGHGQRTQPDGTLYTGGDGNVDADNYIGGDDAQLDSVGNNLIFARQAMLFNPTDMTLDTSTGDVFGPIARTPAALSTYIHAPSAYYNAAVNGSGFPGAPDPAYLGLTDVTGQVYGPAGTPGTLLYQLTDATLAVADHNNNYMATTYRVNTSRLRVNPAPNAEDTNYASWAIAQGHPILAQSCSEIIIDFAADLNGDGRIDTEFGGQSATADAAIYWYDTLRRDPSNPTQLLNPTTSFVWQRPDPNVAFAPVVFNTGVKKIFVFRVDDDEPHPGPIGTPADNSCWPYLIRIRYRLHDTRGRLTSTYRTFRRDGIDNDGDNVTDEDDEERISGRWFERIISVPRP